jgi:GAF domain-containing protein
MTLTALVNDARQPVGVATTERDITERNRAAQRLRFGNRALKALTRWYKALLTRAEPRIEAAEVCRILVEEAGYSLAWVGRFENHPTKNMTPIGWAGLEPGESDPANTLHSLAKLARGSLDRTQKSGRPVAERNIAADPAQVEGRAAALKHHYGAFMVLPLRYEKDPQGVLVIYAPEPEAFVEPEVETLETLSESLALALGADWTRPGMLKK